MIVDNYKDKDIISKGGEFYFVNNTRTEGQYHIYRKYVTFISRIHHWKAECI
jgi:hypothetical protein